MGFQIRDKTSERTKTAFSERRDDEPLTRKHYASPSAFGADDPAQTEAREDAKAQAMSAAVESTESTKVAESVVKSPTARTDSHVPARLYKLGTAVMEITDTTITVRGPLPSDEGNYTEDNKRGLQRGQLTIGGRTIQVLMSVDDSIPDKDDAVGAKEVEASAEKEAAELPIDEEKA